MSNRRATWFATFQIVFLIGAIGFQVAINGANHRQDSEIQQGQDRALLAIRESQYRSCVLNANTLRDQVRREFIDIKRKVLIPTFSGIALTIPEESEARMILEGQVQYMKKRIATIKQRLPDINCRRVYPPLPGQTYPHIKPPRSATSGVRPRHGEPAPPGGGTPTGSSPSSPSSPSQGGGSTNSPGSAGGGTGPNVEQGPTGPQGPQGTTGPQGPGGQPPQPSQPGVLNPITDPLGLDCQLTVVVTVCN